MTNRSLVPTVASYYTEDVDAISYHYHYSSRNIYHSANSIVLDDHYYYYYKRNILYSRTPAIDFAPLKNQQQPLCLSVCLMMNGSITNLLLSRGAVKIIITTNRRSPFTTTNTTTASTMNVLLRRATTVVAPRSCRYLSSSSSSSSSSWSIQQERVWKVYLSGEIHSDWRDVIGREVQNRNLPIILSGPNTSHEDSDDCGAIILGMEEERKNWDHIGASMNSIRTKTLLTEADIVVVRFGEKYRQWNAAMDAGYAAALGKPIITLHPPSISHMLKEVNASASAICTDPEQVVDTLAYVIRGDLPKTPRDGDKFIPIADRLGKGNPNP